MEWPMVFQKYDLLINSCITNARILSLSVLNLMRNWGRGGGGGAGGEGLLKSKLLQDASCCSRSN